MAYVTPSKGEWNTKINGFFAVFELRDTRSFELLINQLTNDEGVIQFVCDDDNTCNYIPVSDHYGCYLVRVKWADEGDLVTIDRTEKISCSDMKTLIDHYIHP